MENPGQLAVVIHLHRREQFVSLGVKFQKAFIELQKLADRYSRRIDPESLEIQKYPQGRHEWAYSLTVRTYERLGITSTDIEHNTES